MKFFLSLIRRFLGWILAGLDLLTRPQPLQRSDTEQERVNSELKDMALYQFHGCPFCIKVRRAAHKLNLPLELRDAKNHPEHRSRLREQGGKIQVPCLRVDRGDTTEWKYESDEIIQYLRERFGPGTASGSAHRPSAPDRS